MSSENDETKVIYEYVGDGAFIVPVPARDLTNLDLIKLKVIGYDHNKIMDTGLYKKVKQRTGTNASPAALSLIAENELDIKDIQGSGQNGSITKGDVEKYLASLENLE